MKRNPTSNVAPPVRACRDPDCGRQKAFAHDLRLSASPSSSRRTNFKSTHRHPSHVAGYSAQRQRGTYFCQVKVVGVWVAEYVDHGSQSEPGQATTQDESNHAYRAKDVSAYDADRAEHHKKRNAD